MTWSAISPLVRTAVIVSDLERSLAFYGELLGLSDCYFEGTLDDPSIAPLLGLDEFSHTEVAILKAAPPAVGMVGLFQISPPPPTLERSQGGIRAGETCLVFYVADLRALCDKLEQGGHTIVRYPAPLKIRDDFQSSEMTFRDPDGVMINCIERDPESVWQERQVPGPAASA